MTPPKVGVVVLCFNGVHDTLDCVRSIGRLTYPDVSLYLVDNGSTDGTLETLHSLRQERTVLIENGENLGYSEGNNVGIRRALEDGCDMVLLLNNDVLLEPGCIEPLVEAVRTVPRAGLLGPTVRNYHEPTRVESAGSGLDLRTGRVWDLGMDDSAVAPREVGYVPGCALMATKEFCAEAGLLDPDYFLYFEDTDWAARAARTGFKILWVPGPGVKHKGSRSTGGPRSALYAYYYARNHLLLMRKNAPLRDRLTFYIRFWRNHIRPSLRAWLREGGPYAERRANAMRAGVRDYFLGRVGKRRE